ncbi:MAG TPA: pentapeptide repeat-containing protein [Rhodocyclaceae bacterium]|uniref:pentapeptide repeat-containing protein n=1 Tax=Thauera sp. TaxID=1905334 RepID=UPI002D079149|nr:pentapeptide repeat-containing protein [Thauera sp.]HRP26573.1 pentapeptide repeat-containing protein [Thauera sp.]HRQ48428.1 pentapeptide repeat-containing protein [Rhodocyclaceae bacterium]
MANSEHVSRLREDVEAWNEWRISGEWPDLRGADLGEAYLAKADLAGVDLTDANLSGAELDGACLREADLVDADLSEAMCADVSFFGANLTGADLHDAFLLKANLTAARLPGANLTDAKLCRADLTLADLTGADLTACDLSSAVLVGTQLTRTTLSRCRVYGVTAWDVNLTDAVQRDLIITPGHVDTIVADAATRNLWVHIGEITVDDLEIAQFIYLLLRNEKLRQVIDTVTAKVVLILGRFTPERKRVLEAIRDALRARGLVPIIFDFEGSENRDLTETVRTLAHLARFIVADLSDPRSIPQELMAIVPILPSVPVVPVIEGSQDPWAMFGSLKRYPWVLEPYRYGSGEALVAEIDKQVIAPAEQAVAQARQPAR